MLCQECGKRQATLHFTKIIKGEKTEFHICEVCAKEKGEMLHGAVDSFSIHHLLSGLLNMDSPSSNARSGRAPAVTACSACGLTYEQFSRSGRFGCSDCYKSFGRRLEALFRKVHSGDIVHHGKVPRRSGGQIRMQRELSDLRLQMKQAIEQEEFEHAARLRDKIRNLEREIH